MSSHEPLNVPFERLAGWLEEAAEREPNDPNAMALASVDADGQPSVRMVLLKGLDARGLVFYTNLGSRKAQALAANPRAALLFHWKSLRRQVRAEGPIEAVADEEADAYFASRGRKSQLGALASDQSQPLESRALLEQRLAEVQELYGPQDPVPRPAYWSGFRLVPQRFEFWQDGAHRLHQRHQLDRRADGTGWDVQLLYP